MDALQAMRDRRPSGETLAVVVSNVLPLVGVTVLGWNLLALVILYWIELGILVLWALVRAVFAGRPSELGAAGLIAGALASKPVSVRVPWTGVRVHLSTLPVVVVAAPLLAVVWLFAGAMTVGVLGVDAPGSDTLGVVVLAGVGVFLSEGASTLLEYFYRGGYREHSAQTAIQSVFVRGAVIGLGGMFTAVVVGLGSGAVEPDESIAAIDASVVGGPLLFGIVLVKFGFDLAERYRGRLVELDRSMSVEIGWAYEPPDPDPVEPVSAERVDRYRPPLSGRVLGGATLAHLRRHPSAGTVGGLLLVVAALFAIGQVWTVVLLLVGASLVVPLALLSIDYWVRYGGVEYRVSDGAIVAYDRLFRVRLWRVDNWDETGLQVERGYLDGWLNTTTVVVECRDRTLRLPRVAAADEILDVFDRPVREST
jgi:hypothetical protein